MNMITPVRMVATCESNTAANARLNPASMEAFRLLPAFNSSRIRSKIRMLVSTAIPILNAIPAIPGSVITGRAIAPPARASLANIPRMAATTIMPRGNNTMFRISAISASNPFTR